MSYPPTEKEDDVKKMVEDHVKKAADADHWLRENPPEIKWEGIRATPWVVDSNDPIVKMTAQYIEEIAGLKPFIGGLPIQCDFRLLGKYADTPEVLFGPLAANLHMPDENVDVESLIETTKIVALILADWCGFET